MLLTLKLLVMLIVLFVLFMVISVKFLLQLIIKTAPKDVQERLRNRHTPVWQMIVGIILDAVCLAGIVYVFITAGADAVRNNMGFIDVFARFFILLEGYKVFDIVVFDWLLLTKLNIYQHFFPEVKGCESMEKFGFNLKSQLLKAGLFALLAAVVALFLT